MKYCAPYTTHNAIYLCFTQPFKTKWLPYALLPLTNKNSEFCPQCIYLFNIIVTKKTAIISPNSINQFVFVVM
jgi:hypothetical protein